MVNDYPSYVKRLFLSDISEIAGNRSNFVRNPETDFIRKRKFPFEDVMNFIVAAEKDSTPHEILKYFEMSIDAPSASAFYQQRQKLLPSTMSYLFMKFNSHFKHKLYRHLQFLACDGTAFNMAYNPKDEESYFPPTGRSETGFNEAYCVAVYDIFSNRYTDMIVQPGRKKNEYRAICDLVDRHVRQGRAKPLFLADRGFGSYNFYAHAYADGAYFLVRLKDLNAARLLGVDASELPKKLDKTVRRILVRHNNKKKRKHPNRTEDYRHVASNVTFDYLPLKSEDEYELQLRIVRFEISPGGSMKTW